MTTKITHSQTPAAIRMRERRAAKKVPNPGTTHRIDDLPPGFKRLRAAKDAEAIREAVLADQINGRAEALAKIDAAETKAVETKQAAETKHRKLTSCTPPKEQSTLWTSSGV